MPLPVQVLNFQVKWRPLPHQKADYSAMGEGGRVTRPWARGSRGAEPRCGARRANMTVGGWQSEPVTKAAAPARGARSTPALCPHRPPRTALSPPPLPLLLSLSPQPEHSDAADGPNRSGFLLPAQQHTPIPHCFTENASAVQ